MSLEPVTTAMPSSRTLAVRVKVAVLVTPWMVRSPTASTVTAEPSRIASGSSDRLGEHERRLGELVGLERVLDVVLAARVVGHDAREVDGERRLGEHSPVHGETAGDGVGAPDRGDLTDRELLVDAEAGEAAARRVELERADGVCRPSRPG